MEKTNAPAQNTRNYMYEKMPVTSSLDASKLDKLFDPLLQNVMYEFEHTNINTIRAKFEGFLSEFYELSRRYRESVPDYNMYVDGLIEFICGAYDIKRQVIFVDVHKYTAPAWGRVYWGFLHYISILLADAFETGKTNHFHNLATIVYHIDLILPCSICQQHYQAIKNEYQVRDVVKSIAFGACMTGVQTFHNVVSANINKTIAPMANTSPSSSAPSKKSMFYVPNFALEYRCIDIPNDAMLKHSAVYIKSQIDWQPKTHALLSTILSVYCNGQPYVRASSLIKHRMYFKKFAGNIKCTMKWPSASTVATHEDDYKFMSLSTAQLQYCLCRALLLKFEDSVFTLEQIEKNETLGNAILEFYRNHTDFMLELIDADIVDMSASEKKTLTAKIKYLNKS